MARSRIDRALLLGAGKRDAVLTLREVQQYGRDSFDDPDYVSIYGMKPAEWYARGVRTLARTAVECTRDRLADLIGRDVAALAGSALDVSGAVVVDPFAGSANTLSWIERHLTVRRAVGFELDDAVFEASKRNVSIVGLNVELLHETYERGLAAITLGDGDILVVFVAPPWGEAFSETLGLDLRRTEPPVTEIVDLVAAMFPRNKLLFATQVHETVDHDSLVELQARFTWWSMTVYDINEQGQRHGLLQGTRGWAPSPGLTSSC